MVNTSQVSAAKKLDTENGFIKANQHNLPQVKYGMIKNFRYDHKIKMISVKKHEWRVHDAANENNGESFVAYPQVKRVGDFFCFSTSSAHNGSQSKRQTLQDIGI